MAAAPLGEPRALTRRERQRQATSTEIKDLARRQLAEHGPGALSLRGIAREMGVSSSALYRYFASYDELITALCIDAYEAVADALTAGRDAVPAEDPVRQWWAVGHAYRRWALDRPADFALIFGTPIPGYQAPPEATGPAAGRISAIVAETYIAAIAAGAADPDRSHVPADVRTGPLLRTLLGDAVDQFPARYAGILLNAWTSLGGYLMGEIFGSLTDLVEDTDRLYDAHLRTVMTGAGFDPARTGSLTTLATSRRKGARQR